MKSQQFVDLLPESYLSEESPDLQPIDHGPMTPAATGEQKVSSNNTTAVSTDAPDLEMPPLSQPETVKPPDESCEDSPMPVTADTADVGASAPAESSYGPMRRRVTGKNGPPALWRPPALRPEDFSEIMHELVPHLVGEATRGSKRDQPDSGPSADAVPSPARHRQRIDEVLSVQDRDHLLEIGDHGSHEVLAAEYLQKRAQKPLPHSHNPPKLQEIVDEGKKVEWNTLLSKPNVLRIHYGKFAHRFIGSHRFIGESVCVDSKSM